MNKGWIEATGLPASVIAGQTTRQFRLDAASFQPSAAPYDGFNLALHVGDNPAQVQQQRLHLLQALQPYGATRLEWLEQTHSTIAYRVTDQLHLQAVNADGVLTSEAGIGCMIMTADCLPIVLSDAAGKEVACIHAGWRGLLNGVIENTVIAMQSTPVYAWLGAAISQPAFEVGAEVFELFTAHDAEAAQAFIPGAVAGKYMADIYQLARLRLKKLGVTQVSGGEYCTYAQEDLFYSYRRNAKTGRMATFVMIQPPNTEAGGCNASH